MGFTEEWRQRQRDNGTDIGGQKSRNRAVDGLSCEDLADGATGTPFFPATDTRTTAIVNQLDDTQ